MGILNISAYVELPKFSWGCKKNKLKYFFTPSLVSPSLKLYFSHNKATLIYISVVFEGF
jgi:hypothetical protein